MSSFAEDGPGSDLTPDPQYNPAGLTPDRNHVAFLTREYPPEVYGGAGTHVEYLTDEVLDVRSRTSVDLGRILTRQHGDSGACHHRQFGADDQVDPDRASRPGRNRRDVVVAGLAAPSRPKH